MNSRHCRPQRPNVSYTPSPDASVPPSAQPNSCHVGLLKGRLTIPIPTETVVGDYEGPYAAVPKAYEDQVLPTKNKILTNNIVVEKVPYYETSNNSEGLTAYIAEEV